MTSLRALVVAYLLGGLTFIPLLICAGLYVILYVTPPIGDPDPAKRIKNDLQASSNDVASDDEKAPPETLSPNLPPPRLKPLQGWLIARRTFEESPSDATYMGMMRSFLDSRSKDRRPRDTYYAVLKGTVLYLYEDEAMSECFAALDAGAYNVEIWPHDGLLDGELYAKRNSIRLSTKGASAKNSPGAMANVSKDMKLEDDAESVGEETSERKKEKANKIEAILAEERSKKRNAAFDLTQPWYLFIKNNSDMEDWYLALVQASSPLPAGATDPADPLGPVFNSDDMAHLVATLDAQPDAIPTRWLNALLGRLFFSVYRTARVEAYILGRLASKLSKVKRPGFLTALSVREVSVGSRPPTVATPMLKELTRWGDAALELKFMFDGEIRLTIAATAEVSLGTRFRPYVVQLVLAVVVRKVEGNVLVKVKRPPSNRIWYAFTSMPKLEIDVLPVVSDREIKWGVVLKPIETQLKEIIRESIVMPNMDDIPFFESGGYEHRGGIWPDAARRQYSPENDDPSTAPDPAINASLSPDTLSKTSSSAPPSVVGLTTDPSQTQYTTDLPPISESTPALPLSPKSKSSTATDEPKSASTDGLVPTAGNTRSRTPSPIGAKADSTDETQEKALKRDAEKEKEKPAPTLEVMPSKRMSWFSRTPISASPSPSPVDTSRGRSVSTAPTGTKSAAPNDRARSTPRSPVLLEVEGDTQPDSSLSSPVQVNAPGSDAESTSRTPARTYSPPRSELPTQDTLSDDQSTSRRVPAPTSGDEPLRSTTPIVTVNGTRRTTVSHHASQSASGNFYSGSVSDSSSSSLPPAGTSPTATYSDSEVVKGSIVSTPIDASASSATSSLHTPSDAGFAGPNELARTFSNSSTHSLSAPIDTNATQATSSDTNTAPNSASFLSTWKTRAADKQALSNTAKEAMKKWSVGWNNLKKGVEDERERRRGSGIRGDTSGLEDEGSGSDAGMGGVGSGAAKKGPGRKTYAELRADVLSRREGAPTSAETKNGNPSTQHDSPFSGGLSSSPTPSNKSRPNSISVAPSAPKTTTEVHTGAPDILEQPKPIIEQPKPRPIGVQPGRGATMMIPGIHASHQGEVMALGSAPAEKEPVGQDKPQDKAVERERTLSQNGRPSSIQNVYRLFGQRTISTSSSDASNLPGAKVEIVKQPKAAASSASIDTISITPVDDEATDSPFSPSTPRTVAPTLPPRPVPMMSVPAPRSPPPTLPPRKQSVSAASEALKKLAADDAARTSRPQSPPVPASHDENASGASTPSGPHRVASPPPLPPRAPVTAS